MVFGKVVEIQGKEYDRYGRLAARVIVDGKDVSIALVESGLAWHYKKYSSDLVLTNAETAARTAGIGIWSLLNPAPPWELRARQSREHSVKSSTGVYHGNRKSKVFHASHYRYYNCKNCTAVFQSREDAIKAGYRPCKRCKP
jgi:hypothetical protein